MPGINIGGQIDLRHHRRCSWRVSWPSEDQGNKTRKLFRFVLDGAEELANYGLSVSLLSRFAQPESTELLHHVALEDRLLQQVES